MVPVPVVDNNATLLRDLLSVNLKQLHDDLSIWCPQMEDAEDEAIENIGEFFARVLEEYPFIFVVTGNPMPDWKEVAKDTYIVSPDLDAANLYSMFHNGSWLLYLSGKPLDIDYSTTVTVDTVSGMLKDKDCALVIHIWAENRDWLFGFNEESDYLRSLDAYKDSYLNDIYPDFVGLIGKWFNGIYRKAFRNDSDVAFFLTGISDEKTREKILHQADRLISEIPFPYDKVSVISKREHTGENDARDWIKSITHEFQLRVQYDDREKRRKNSILAEAGKYKERLQEKGLRLYDYFSDDRSLARPYRLTSNLHIVRDGDTTGFPGVGQIELLMCDDNEFMPTDDILASLDDQIEKFLESYKSPGRFIVNVAIIAVTVLVILVIVIVLLNSVG